MLTFDQVVGGESRRILNAVLSNDPRPHYFHQSNLITGDDENASAVMYVLLDAGSSGGMTISATMWRCCSRR